MKNKSKKIKYINIINDLYKKNYIDKVEKECKKFMRVYESEVYFYVT